MARPDASVDAVLLLGPLYHLVDGDDRVRAWREAGRVVRPGGPVVAASISRFAPLFDGFVKDLYADARFRPVVENVLGTRGRWSPAPDTTWFTTAYFQHPEELPSERYATPGWYPSGS